MFPNIEQQPLTAIRDYQTQQLQQQLQYLQLHSPYYRRLFDEYALDISTIRSIDDLHRLPFTTKDDLQRYGSDFLCVPKRQIVDYVTTSGTLGNPVTFALTDADLERLAYNEAISMACTGINQDDILLLTTTIDRRFMAGLAYFLGARKLGAGIVRAGSGLPELQWDTIKRVEPTILVAVPSFILKLIEYAEQHNIDYRKTSIRAALCIGEPLRDYQFHLNTLGQRIKNLWDIKLFSTYASTEMSTAFTECQEGRGGHEHPELIITEVVDEDGNQVADGEMGEVVFTTLGVEAMPLLRFKTGDICHYHTTACACGRNTPRLGAVVGRKQQMIKYKGTTLYPPALHNILEHFTEIQGFVIEVSTNAIGTDEILLRLASSDQSESFIHRIRDRFRAQLRVAPQLLFQPLSEINALRFPPMSRKPISFIDKRGNS